MWHKSVTFIAGLSFLWASVAAGQPFPPPKEPDIPPYDAPRRILDALSLPPGLITVKDGFVLYDAPAHLRLTLSLQLEESLSNVRARESYFKGWFAAAEMYGEALSDERTLRLEAEARAKGEAARADAIKDVAQQSFKIGDGAGWWVALGVVGALGITWGVGQLR